MAEVKGLLREDATDGEKRVKKYLEQNLPKEFTVYVETPIYKSRELRYPDFTILTNYGVVVLEVKDWVIVEGYADPSGVTVRTRKGETRWEKNPVNTAREMAYALANEFNARWTGEKPGEAIPWGYAAVLINLPTSVITRLQYVWGEEFVLGKDDLDIPDLLLSRIKKTMPAWRMRSLSSEELGQLRAAIFPSVEIQTPDQRQVILDEQQETLVIEPVRQETPALSKSAKRAQAFNHQEQLFESLREDEQEEEIFQEGGQISQRLAIRLVRGFAGSGKTVVLIQRAHYLAALYPSWRIGVFTFNKPLQKQLEQNFRGSSVKPRTFHSLCFDGIQTQADSEEKLEPWINSHAAEYPILNKLGHTQAVKELNWIRDTGLIQREDYLHTDRKGIGKDFRLTVEDRNAIFDVLENYRKYLHVNNRWDWSEIPLLTLERLEKAVIKPEKYDVILVDEAQDWAPVWFKVLQHYIDPDRGMIFLADDPSQSIYRHFSWKEKGISVVGRTRWLKVPYRNTYEIYRAAYGMIANDAEIQKSLSEEGEIIEPDLSSQAMRHGSVPLVRRFRSTGEELTYIKDTVLGLQQQGYTDQQIAVLVRYQKDLKTVSDILRGSNVSAYVMHSFKGLEKEVIIIPFLQNTFIRPEDEHGERRLMYMAMSRARAKLYMTYSSKLPKVYDVLRQQGLVDFVE